MITKADKNQAKEYRIEMQRNPFKKQNGHESIMDPETPESSVRRVNLNAEALSEPDVEDYSATDSDET